MDRFMAECPGTLRKSQGSCLLSDSLTWGKSPLIIHSLIAAGTVRRTRPALGSRERERESRNVQLIRI